jgi:putative flippase GtrA
MASPRRVLAFFGQSFLQFAAIGLLAMFVDMGVLWVVTSGLGIGLYVGRAISFLCAATTTWFLNRTITFRHSRMHRIVVEYLRFLGVAMMGGVVNLGVYSAIVFAAHRWLILSQPWSGLLPYFGVACGSAAGLLFNYTGSKLAVFPTPPYAPDRRP